MQVKQDIIQTNNDSINVKEKIFLRFGFKAIYLNNYFRGSNFVRKIDLNYRINSRLIIGGGYTFGWRFGKNFGEDIGSKINVRTKSISKPYDDKPYSLDEWINDRIFDYGPGYALNFKYQGYNLFLEYQLDKNGIGEIFNHRKIHWSAYFGLSYITGEVAGKLSYTYKQKAGITFNSSEYEYFFVYEKINYTNISIDLMLRFSIQPKKKDFILPGLSIYYVYAPDQVNNGMKNFGWLWDIKIFLWKK
jgi:hypothetical protein